MTERPLTIMLAPESAYGPTNNCIGIGDVLRRRGHRIVFAAEASWKGRLAALGFAEELIDLAPPAEQDQYDNAQRMHELGLGVRLDPYRFTDADLHGALSRLLGDTALCARLARAAAVIQQRDGLHQAASIIEAAATRPAARA
jgi:UDP:flavonoid glycosyltransferase YjiC (YdhE family)